MERGPEAVDAAELLAIILGSGTTRASALDLARELIFHFGSLEHLARATVRQLRQIKGIGEAKAVSIVAAFELGRRRRTLESSPKQFNCSRQMANYFRSRMQDLQHEELWAIFLDGDSHVLGEMRLSAGSHHRTLMDSRKLMGEIYNHNATAIILLHNHPSGSLKPSDQDKITTREVRDLCDRVQCKLLDHIIISRRGYYSFQEEKEQVFNPVLFHVASA